MKRKEYIHQLEQVCERLALENMVMAGALKRSRENYPEQFEKRKDLN